MKFKMRIARWTWQRVHHATVAMMLLLLVCLSGRGHALTSFESPSNSAEVTSSPAPRADARPAYTLPPEKLRKAIRVSRDYTILDFSRTAWDMLFVLLLLSTRTLSRLGQWAESLTSRRWLQGFIFLPVVLLLIAASHMPFSMTSHWLATSYGFSVQHWGSWFLDHGKALLLTLSIGTLLLLVLMMLIRRFPRSWWLWFWAGSLPVIVFSVFVVPVLIDPIFNHFESLSASNPALVRDLERVVARTGTNIPPARMFLMKASEKVTVPNAYVTGLGATKRVVVWDTTIQTAPTDDILMIFAHESGHYVLNHIWKGIAFSSVLTLLLLWIGYRLSNWLVARYGERWHVANLEDWAAVGVLLLAFVLLNFLSDPIANSFSRAQEHAADVYGQEAMHGIVADPQTTALHSFQLLGEAYLEDPNPGALLEFWTYDHPSTQHRATFAAGYNPWVAGQRPAYFSPDHR